MKIMFCLGSMTKGGAERVIANLSNQFISNNDVSIVVTPPDEPMYDLDEKIKYYTLDDGSKKTNIIFRNFNRIRMLKKIIKSDNPDIIVSLLPEPTIRLMIVNLILRKKVIISVRNDPKIEFNNFLKKSIANFLYSFANGFIFQTEEARDFFCKKIQLKSVIIPNPIKDEFICDPFIGQREKKIVTVGRLVEQKNHKLLIESFSLFCNNNSDYELHIYGDGPLKKDLQDYTNSLGLSNRVLFKGEVDDVKSEIYDSSLFVLSSDYEGMPNALMEAMALGIPCISTNCPCGGPSFLINNGVNGILVDCNDSIKMSNAMIDLIDNKSLRETISFNSSESCKKFNSKTINEKWYNYIIEVYGGTNETD